ALACFREMEEIARELGDRQNIVIAIGNRSLVHSDRGEYAEAIACNRECEEIARELKDRGRLAIAVGNRGNLHADLNEYAEALACYQQATEEHRAIGFLKGLSYWLVGAARVLVDLVESGE